MRTLLTATLLAVTLAFAGNFSLSITPVHADTTGLASLHTLTQRGNKMCMIGHFHYGSGNSSQGKASALAKAKRSWADFVIVEYGTDWSRFSIAAARGITCTGSNSTYSCSVEASPCKYGTARRKPVQQASNRATQKRSYQKRKYTKTRYRTTSYKKRKYKKRSYRKRSRRKASYKKRSFGSSRYWKLY